MTTVQAYLDQLIQIRGDSSQRERWRAGRLPDEELRAIARDAFFEPLAKFPRFERIESWSLRHTMPCAMRPDDLTFKSGIWTGPLTRTQWARLNKIRAAGATIQNSEVSKVERYHECSCTCSAKRRELSVLVTIPWMESPLSREYAL